MTRKDARTRNEVIIHAILDTGMTTHEAATRFGLSQRWIQQLLTRYNNDGIEGLAPRSKAPHTHPNQTPTTIEDHILALRDSLTTQGLDAGAHSIHAHLDPATRPSISTIWRILTRHNKITPQPQKRPRTSWKRFQAAAPNECWQSDFTHYPLADGTDTEIISWLDDHARYLLHATCHPRITGPLVINTFTATTSIHGYPASTLTDNGMVYTTRFAHGANGTRAQPNGFEQLLADLCIVQKNGSPGHPQTQGKIERYHHTLKKWLAAQPPPATLDDLQGLLDQFRHLYNMERPHQALGRRTPYQAYTALPKAQPTLTHNNRIWRIRYDTVDRDGKITLRYAGRLRHLGIGRAHKHRPVRLLIASPDTIVIDRDTGEILAEHTLNPNKNYQPKKPPGGSPHEQ